LTTFAAPIRVLPVPVAARNAGINAFDSENGTWVVPGMGAGILNGLVVWPLHLWTLAAKPQHIPIGASPVKAVI
jgi:hypothetical protein